MDNKITALSDDELMEVTGGLVQLINPSSCKMKYSNKKSCKPSGDRKCYWDESYNVCMGGCL